MDMKHVLQPTAALTLSLLVAATHAQDDSTLSTVVVTGNRGAEQRTVTSSPVPIDVVSAKQLQSTGKPGLMEALSAVIPSLTLPENRLGRQRHCPRAKPAGLERRRSTGAGQR